MTQTLRGGTGMRWASAAALGVALRLALGTAAASPPAGAAERLLEAAVRERGTMAEGARVVVSEVKPSDPKAWGRAKEIARIEIPPGAATAGLVTAMAHLDNASGAAPMWLLAKVEVQMPAVVARKAIARGAVISAEDVALEWTAARGREAIAGLEGAVGKRSKVSIAPGEPLEPRMVQAPAAVERGESVTVKVRGRGYQLTAAGETLSTAGLGELVRVKVVATGKIVEALVLSPSLVEVSANLPSR